ncbi:hypothetical protein JTE90_013161, partial [Oedothorax gibbosus]
GKTDLAIADFTITYEREQVVDFTMPFMNFGDQHPFFFGTRQKTPPPLLVPETPVPGSLGGGAFNWRSLHFGFGCCCSPCPRFSPYEWPEPYAECEGF